MSHPYSRLSLLIGVHSALHSGYRLSSAVWQRLLSHLFRRSPFACDIEFSPHCQLSWLSDACSRDGSIADQQGSSRYRIFTSSTSQSWMRHLLCASHSALRSRLTLCALEIEHVASSAIGSARFTSHCLQQRCGISTADVVYLKNEKDLG